MIWGGEVGRDRGRKSGEARGGRTYESGVTSPLFDPETYGEQTLPKLECWGNAESRGAPALLPIWLPGRNPLSRVF